MEKVFSGYRRLSSRHRPGCPTGVIAGSKPASQPAIETQFFYVTGPSPLCMHCTSIQRALLHRRIRNLCHQHQWCTCPYRCGYRARWTHVFLCRWQKGQSYLYRIRYVGNESTNLSPLDTTSKHAQARQTSKMLERFHGHSNPKAVQWLALS